MEIIVVSDTVRQRRSRTPSQNENIATDSKSKTVILPDVLPKTFHLAESSALFSQINEPQKLLTSTDAAEDESKFSVVEIRETNLTSPKKVISTYNVENMSTCSILESVSYLQPSCVETVHIIDVTSEPSDTDTCCSTPNLEERPEIHVSSDDDDGESDEYETGELGPELSPTMKVFTRQISKKENKKPLQKERDVLKDSEQNDKQNKIPPKPQRKRLTPTLKEILSATSDRDRFYGADKERFDEPLIFSDDDDNHRFRGQSADSFNRDMVLMKNPSNKQTNQKKIPKFELRCVFLFCQRVCCVHDTRFKNTNVPLTDSVFWIPKIPFRMKLAILLFKLSELNVFLLKNKFRICRNNIFKIVWNFLFDANLFFSNLCSHCRIALQNRMPLNQLCCMNGNWSTQRKTIPV